MHMIAGIASSLEKFLQRRPVWTRVDAARSTKRRRQVRTEFLLPSLSRLGRLALCLSTLVAFRAPADEPAGLSDAIRSYTRESALPRFQYALVDLNEDGLLDAVVLLTDRSWCGAGGCTMLIFKGSTHGFVLVSRAAISNAPIRVSADVRHGWHTLLVSVQGGGITPGSILMRFDGAHFPFNPSTQPRATQTEVDSATLLSLIRSAGK